MPYVIGTDEAGYGPNLGPLVISASVWEVPDGVRSEHLYGRLDRVISGGAIAGAAARDAVVAAAAKGKGRRHGDGTEEGRPDACTTRHNGQDAGAPVAMADSKVLYQSGKGLGRLERGLWAAFALLGERPCTCDEVWSLLAPDCCEQRRAAVCDGRDDPAAPLDADPAEFELFGPAVRAGVAAAGVRLACLRSRAVFPAEFNDAVQRCGSKGTALSRWTLDLIARSLASLPEGRISVLCDKHGARDHYLPLLMECFPETFIEIHDEGRQRSIYWFGPTERRVDICFQARGEGHLPTALASMASKYLRELAMRALNAFWCTRVPGLAPTAGYPNDAGRFKKQITAAQEELGIDDRVIWRAR